MRSRGKFEKRGWLAIAGAFWGLEFEVVEPEQFRLEGDVAVVTICGPMTHHTEWFWDSYDDIKERVAAAIASPAKSVVLEIDSPGGDVSGCFETATAIRDMAAEAKKPLFAFCDGNMCSGGYALACAADFIAAPATGMVGSIGVISTFFDVTKADAQYGVRYAFVTSGKRKADGNPHVPISESALDAEQNRVNALAEQFFALVSASRGIGVDAVAGLEANVFVGNDAKGVGLIDAVMTKDQLLAHAAGTQTEEENAMRAKSKSTKAGWKDDMIKAAEDGDEEAKKALAALDDEKKDEEKSTDEDKDEKTESTDEEKKAESDKDDEKAEDEDKDEKVIAEKAKLVAEQGTLERRVVGLEKRLEDEEREKLLAARPDLTKTQIASLRSEPLPTMKKMLALIPTPKKDPAAELKTAPTVGAGFGQRASRLSKSDQDELDAKMGLDPKSEVRWERGARVFPQVSPDTARTMLDKKPATAGGVR